MILQPTKEKNKKSLLILQKVIASLTKGLAENLPVSWVTFFSAPQFTLGQIGGTYFRDGLTRLSSTFSSIGRQAKLQLFISLMSVGTLWVRIPMHICPGEASILGYRAAEFFLAAYMFVFP